VRRSGRILGPGTLLKNDTFLGLQKLSLPERIEGAPNFRAASLALGKLDESTATSPTTETRSRSGSTARRSGSSNGFDKEEQVVYGTGMPTCHGCALSLHPLAFGCDGGPQGKGGALSHVGRTERRARDSMDQVRTNAPARSCCQTKVLQHARRAGAQVTRAPPASPMAYRSSTSPTAPTYCDC
jgi:hypothetical protein